MPQALVAADADMSPAQELNEAMASENNASSVLVQEEVKEEAKAEDLPASTSLQPAGSEVAQV